MGTSRYIRNVRAFVVLLLVCIMYRGVSITYSQSDNDGIRLADDIVVWVPKKKVLFGGCLIKSQNAGNLGNTAEADLINYPATLKKVREKYSGAKIVISGHGQSGGIELINHTIELCNNEN